MDIDLAALEPEEIPLSDPWLCLACAIMTRNAIGKGLALCSSLLLAGCFVAYRQNQAGKPHKPAVMPGSKNPGSLVDWPKTGQQGTEESRQGSDFVRPQLKTATGSPNGKTVFPSSKSIDAILRPGDLPPPSKILPERALLPGSKALSSGDAPINRNDVDKILNGRRKSAEETQEPKPASDP